LFFINFYSSISSQKIPEVFALAENYTKTSGDKIEAVVYCGRLIFTYKNNVRTKKNMNDKFDVTQGSLHGTESQLSPVVIPR